MLSLAIGILFSERGKATTAIVGVVFSVVLVNVQGGLYLGLIRKASVLTEGCEADLWVAHRGVENVDFSYEIPVHWLGRVRGVPGVVEAEPYIVSKAVASLADGGFEDVWILGADANSMLGGGWSFVEGDRHDLRRPDGVSFDELDARKLGHPVVGDVIEINGRRARLVARTRGILAFGLTPYLFTTIDNARSYARIPDGHCSYILVRVEPGTNAVRVRDELRQLLPDADVYGSEEFGRMSRDYFLGRTGIGISFGASTFLGVLVGLLMVGQSLYALVVDRIAEFATLKAIGADEGQLLRVVFAQAASVAAIGSLIGVGLVAVIERNWSTPVAPIEIPVELQAASVALVFGICMLAAAFPVLRIRRIDPASVLQG
jgi:putative ABC transport system permease protein